MGVAPPRTEGPLVPTRLPNVLILRLPRIAGLMACLALVVATAFAQTPAPPAPAALAGAQAGWRGARGLDPPDLPLLERYASAALASDPMDEHWLSGYGLPVPDGPIQALLPYQGLLIAGGAFRTIGDLVSPGIAAWDGTGWSRFGDFPGGHVTQLIDRKSTRLNSSHLGISYAVFCL